MTTDWLERWREGRIGWHETAGNAQLKAFWPRAARGRRVLVPLCGKTPDLAWLAEQGCDVIGVELSPLAAEAFFDEQRLPFNRDALGGLPCYRAKDRSIAICVGDYFDWPGPVCGALYDRGALVATPVEQRPFYVRHTDSLLARDALKLVITLEYDQHAVSGPPYSVPAAELLSYWPDLESVSAHNAIDNSPPKFRDAGLREVTETTWLTQGWIRSQAAN